jgi:hypothetical protein
VAQVGTYNVTVMVEGEASLPSPTAILRLNCPKDYFGVDGEPCTPCPVRRCTVKGRGGCHAYILSTHDSIRACCQLEGLRALCPQPVPQLGVPLECGT